MLAVAVVAFVLYMRTVAWPYLVVGVAGITLVVPEAVIDWTGDSLGPAGGVLIAGLTLLGASLAGFRMRQEATEQHVEPSVTDTSAGTGRPALNPAALNLSAQQIGPSGLPEPDGPPPSPPDGLACQAACDSARPHLDRRRLNRSTPGPSRGIENEESSARSLRIAAAIAGWSAWCSSSRRAPA